MFLGSSLWRGEQLQAYNISGNNHSPINHKSGASFNREILFHGPASDTCQHNKPQIGFFSGVERGLKAGMNFFPASFYQTETIAISSWNNMQIYFIHYLQLSAGIDDYECVA